jgi:hypothetical protein
VVEELAKKGESSRNPRVVQLRRAGVDHRRGQLTQQLIRRRESIELLEHDAEPALFVATNRDGDIASPGCANGVLPRHRNGLPSQRTRLLRHLPIQQSFGKVAAGGFDFGPDSINLIAEVRRSPIFRCCC